MKYLFLLVVVIISFIVMSPLSLDASNEENNELWRWLVPGISFSIFIVVDQRKFFNIYKLVLLFVILMVGYCINLMIGLSSWGLAVPIAGIIGGTLIYGLISYNQQEAIKAFWSFVGFGALSSLIGLILYFAITKDLLEDGIGFGLIVSLWQLVIGVMYIRTMDRLNKETSR